MEKTARIYVAGHRGMVGSAIHRLLLTKGYEKIITATKNDLDLCETSSVSEFFEKYQPEFVFMAAAKVGGIQANIDSPADFAYINMMIQNNLIHQSYLKKVKKVLFLGSSCIYPCDCSQPIKEEYLLTGPLERTNEGYALSKISGLKLLKYYYEQYGLRSVSLMPCNLYGPGDSFDLRKSHVLSALVKRFVDAAQEESPNITLWGSGIAKREFMHVTDVAEACLFLM
jgi:GDP-L-fucose synthase